MGSGNQSERRERRFAEIAPPPPMQRLTDPVSQEPIDLGPLELLLGVWIGAGTGWNMIALPFHESPPPPDGFKFRVLMNQYNEELRFTFVDDNVKNRGLARPGSSEFDQFVATLDYQQKIAQVAMDDRPASEFRGKLNEPIHHEPGLWLYEKNRRSKDDQLKNGQVTEIDLDVARLASIPHGNSVLALGKSERHVGMPPIPPVSGLPMGQFEDVKTPEYDFKSEAYFAPYKHYIDNPFMGTVDPAVVVGFPGFNPADMNEILRFANQGVEIVNTTTLTVDSTRRSGGILNVPFSVREAEPVSMKSTFWIQELAETDTNGKPKLRLQYSQVVMLHFFHPRQDEFPERAVWPHISIATLEKVTEDTPLLAA